MNKLIVFFFLLFLPGRMASHCPEWGFFAHRLINRMAVFILPEEMLGFYKRHIDYVTIHAVDPDKRRYASKFEAIRHYIDLDHWDVYPFEAIPRYFHEAILRYGSFLKIGPQNDTVIITGTEWALSFGVEDRAAFDFFYQTIWPKYYDDEITLPCEHLAVPDSCDYLVFVDHFREYGILPYHLNAIYNRLVEAFRNQNADAILRLSAEIGHYISDGHVPLHTTENYNGQLTDQVGIHAFWESRLPELFAESHYDFFVGKAEFIENLNDYIWSFVIGSHALLEEVLAKERTIHSTFPQDAQYCFDERLERTVWIECEDYSRAYHSSLNGMVENRMRASVHATGSFWYTAWVMAGQPDLDHLNDKAMPEGEADQKLLDAQFRAGEILGRKHNNE